MAFNPFHGFRKHAKGIFAVLTIICMLTFVMSGSTGFRGGDALDWVVRRFGGTGSQGEVITTLYGDKVYERQIERAAYDRSIANDFMLGVIQVGIRSTMQAAVKELKKPPLRGDAAAGLLGHYRRSLRDFYFDDVAMQFQGRDPAKDDNLRAIFAVDPTAKPAFEAARKNPFALLMPETRQARRQELISLRAQLLEQHHDSQARVLAGLLLRLSAVDPFGRFQFRSFFGASTRRQDMLEQRVWLHQADKLGINFTEADLRAEVNRISPTEDVLSGDSGHDQTALAMFFPESGKRRPVDLTTLYKALDTEYRVSLAQAIIVGEEPGFRGALKNALEIRPALDVPAAIVPAEYLQFYRDQRATLTVDLLPVPAAAFLPEVDKLQSAGKLNPPTERELQALWTAYRSEEPKPWSSTPGFKEPQRIRLEWIAKDNIAAATFSKLAQAYPSLGFLSGFQDPREQFYLGVAEKFIRAQINPKDLETLTGVQGIAAPIPSPLIPLAPGTYLGVQGLINDAYETLKSARGDFGQPKLAFPVPSLFRGDPTLAYYTALNLPSALASTLGQAAPLGPFSPLRFDVLVTGQVAEAVRAPKYQAEPLKAELRKRGRLVGSLVASSVATPFGGVPLWMFADHQDKIETLKDGRWTTTLPPLDPSVSMNGLRFQVLDQAAATLAKDLQRSDLERLEKDLKAAKSDPDDARKVIDTALKRHPWLAAYHGQSDRAIDRATLATSRSHRILLASSGEVPATLQERLNAASRLFTETKLYDPQSTFNLLSWKTEVEPAKSSATFAEAREHVFQVWKLLEARKLARRKAEEIRARVAGKSPKEARAIFQTLLEEHAGWGNLVHLDKVARLVPVGEEEGSKTPAVLPTSKATQYVPYKVPEGELPYPPADFLNELMKLKQTEAALVPDRPLKDFYVAYVAKRSATPSEDDILVKVVGKNNLRDMKNDNIWKMLEEEKKKAFRKEVLAALRKEAAAAGKLDARGRFELRPGIKPDSEPATNDQ